MDQIWRSAKSFQNKVLHMGLETNLPCVKSLVEWVAWNEEAEFV